jgi:uncharacterized membrane protein (DUF2068 family)
VAYQSGTMLRVIGGFKLAKALVLVAAGVGAMSLGPQHLHQIASAFPYHEANHVIDEALAKVARVDARRLHELGVGCFVYAALFALEGVGLWMREVWAEYVTIAITGSFIPLEVYEMVAHGSVVKAVVIALNVAIVVYLVWRLRRDNHWPFR